MDTVYTLTHRKSMLEIKVKLPDMKRLLPERADLVEAVSANAAERVMESVRDNFLRRGGKNFWRAAADSVEIEYGGAGRSLVTIGQRGVRLQWLGGVVRPQAPRKLLAIPATESKEYARSVPGLMMVPLQGYPHLRGLLVATEETEAKRQYKDRPAGRRVRRAVIDSDGKMQVLYRLVDETRHEAHPDVLPSKDMLHETVQAAAEEAIRAML